MPISEQQLERDELVQVLLAPLGKSNFAGTQQIEVWKREDVPPKVP